jgi:hypothetical protein
VIVRWYQATGCKIQPGQGDTKSVETRKLADCNCCYIGTDVVGGVSSFVETRKEKIIRSDSIWILAYNPIYKYCMNSYSVLDVV